MIVPVFNSSHQPLAWLLVTLVRFSDFSSPFCHSLLGYKWLPFYEGMLRTRIYFFFPHKIPLSVCVKWISWRRQLAFSRQCWESLWGGDGFPLVDCYMPIILSLSLNFLAKLNRLRLDFEKCVCHREYRSDCGSLPTSITRVDAFLTAKNCKQWRRELDNTNG